MPLGPLFSASRPTPEFVRMLLKSLPGCGRPVAAAAGIGARPSSQLLKPCIPQGGLPFASNAKAQGCVAQRRASRQRLGSVIAAAAATSIGLQVVKEDVSACQRRLTVTVPGAGVQQCFHAAVSKMREITGDIPGFRRSNIPLSMIIQQCGGPRNFKLACIEEVLMTALPLAMENAVKQEGVVPDSERLTSNIQDLEAVFDPAKPLTFTVEYDCVPPLTWKKSYKDLEVTIQDTGDFTTDAAAAEGLVRQVLKEKGFQSVAERGLQQGDTAIVDLKFTPEGSKIPLPGLSADKARFDTDTDPLNLTPHLLGSKVGDVRHFKVTLPRDYRIELWQGMVVDVEVKIRELFVWTLPNFDDEFVKTHYSGQFDTAEDMKKSFLATTAMERVQHLDMALGEAVMQAVVEAVEVPALPESLIMDMGSTQYRAVLLDMIEKKAATAEEVDKLATEEMVSEYCSKKRSELEALCIFNVAADEIWASEGLQLDQSTVEEEIKTRTQVYETQKLEYDEEAIREQVVDTLKHLQVVEWLKDNVKRNVLPWNSK